MNQIVVFTDLDGTLLDAATYSFEPALPALSLLQRKGIPLVFCSSKTRSEIEHYRRMLGNRHPFISENGGGIFIPEGYFVSAPPTTSCAVTKEKEYTVMRLGAPYPALRRALAELRAEGFAVQGFGDLTVEEVAALTGLDLEQAAMAKQREFDEPFLLSAGKEAAESLRGRIQEKGFSFTRGRLMHILGASDKGKAVGTLSALYRGHYGGIVTVAVGDRPNDLPMLRRVDVPIAVRQPNGRFDPEIDLPGFFLTEGSGPTGWNEAILRIVPELTANRVP